MATQDILISADSHVMEPPDLWVKGLPAKFTDVAPRYPEHRTGEGFQRHPGGQDPHARIKEMATDGVSAEVLYPTLMLPLFSLDDPELERACFRVYNDWLIEYCSVNPEQLIGVGGISVYDMDLAVAEVKRCHEAGLKGVIIWQAPHADLPFRSDHYNRLWDVCQDLEMPISLHILTGWNYSKDGLRKKGVEQYRDSVNHKLLDGANAVFDFIFYGILDRWPNLKIVIVENEVGWIPFLVQQWDYYHNRFKVENPLPITEKPSFYFERQVFATFFNDAVGGYNLARWGGDNCMWSNDFPHPNSTWPNSRQVIERHLGHLSAGQQRKLVCDNVARLYGLKVPVAA